MSLDPANSKSGYSAHDTDKSNAYRNAHQEVGMNEGGGENSVEESQNSSEVQAGFHNTLDTNCAMNTGMECVALIEPDDAHPQCRNNGEGCQFLGGGLRVNAVGAVPRAGESTECQCCCYGEKVQKVHNVAGTPLLPRLHRRLGDDLPSWDRFSDDHSFSQM